MFLNLLRGYDSGHSEIQFSVLTLPLTDADIHNVSQEQHKERGCIER